MKISASILASKLSSLSSVIPDMSQDCIDLIHMDIMDGNFVPQISFGEALTKEVKEMSSIPLDVHLMVNRPEDHVQKYFALRPYCITFHRETTHFPIRLAQEIQKNGTRAGISLNPGTSIRELESVLPHIDLVLLMTVEPGFYGQKFIEGSLQKVSDLRKMIDQSGHRVEIEVDGGINLQNVKQLDEAGADISVVGAGLFREGTPNENGKRLKSACQ